MLSLFLSFLKVGTFGFGSGPAMLALIEKEVVGKGLMSPEQFTEAVAASMALPGPLATKASLYCGYHVAGVPGALLALLGMLLPSTLAMLLLVQVIHQFRGNAKLEGALRAMKPVVVAVFLFLAVGATRGIRPGWDTILLGTVALVLLLLKVDPAWVIIGALGIGLLIY
jgi:chromate transporter